MINPKGFIKLIGGEYELMQKAEGSVVFKFYTASLIILLIAVISFASIFYAVKLLFHTVIIEILLSAFLSLLFVLLFIFIVNTFTKDARQRKLLNFSNITRLGFVMFIGLIISKPIEAFVYRDTIGTDVETHKAELIKEHSLKIDQLFSSEFAKLTAEKNKYKRLNKVSGFDADILQVDQQVAAIDEKKKALAVTSTLRIEQGAYFVYRIKAISGKYPGAWLISLFMVALFLTPVFLVYSIPSDEPYFQEKNVQERKIIVKAYKEFTEKYSEIFYDRYNVKLEFYSKFEDPPFNSLLKVPSACKSANDFHEHYAQH